MLDSTLVPIESPRDGATVFAPSTEHLDMALVTTSQHHLL